MHRRPRIENIFAIGHLSISSVGLFGHAPAYEVDFPEESAGLQALQQDPRIRAFVPHASLHQMESALPCRSRKGLSCAYQQTSLSREIV